MLFPNGKEGLKKVIDFLYLIGITTDICTKVECKRLTQPMNLIFVD